VGGDGILELDGHDRAAGEVDARVQATRQQQRDDARHEEDGREQVEVLAVFDEVEHRLPQLRVLATAGRRDGTQPPPICVASMCMPNMRSLCAQDWLSTSSRKVRVTKIALNSDTTTPMPSTRAKPMMIVAPNCWPKMYSTAQVISVEVFESRID